MAKPINLKITIELPNGHNADRVSIGADGAITLLNKDGSALIPSQVERSAFYERPKGLKYQSRTIFEQKLASVGGLDELSGFDRIIAIDTNTILFDGIKVSAAFFIVCRLIREANGFRVESLDGSGHTYEFHDVSGNPEMLAILKVANDTIRTSGFTSPIKIAFITDSDMNRHEAISRQEQPIYGNQFLPTGFELHYASVDTGQELANKLLRFCDKESTRYLKRLRRGETSFRKTGLPALKEDGAVGYRYHYYPSFTMDNPIVTGVAVTKDTKYSINVIENENLEPPN